MYIQLQQKRSCRRSAPPPTQPRSPRRCPWCAPRGTQSACRPSGTPAAAGSGSARTPLRRRRGSGPSASGTADGREQVQLGARVALSPDRRRSRSMATTRAACARSTPSPPARRPRVQVAAQAWRTHLPHDLAVDDRLVARLDGGAVRQHAHLGRELVRRLHSAAAARAGEACRPCPMRLGGDVTAPRTPAVRTLGCRLASTRTMPLRTAPRLTFLSASAAVCPATTCAAAARWGQRAQKTLPSI